MNPPAQNPTQIPEINGLRAVAVLAVLVFHAFPDVAPGGYIGVDIFFVISGYVISRSYLDALQSGERRLPDFYLARVRRLAPAYFLVLFACTFAAWFLFDPLLLSNYGESLAAQPVYLQNVVFWLQGDYFEKAITKPLLHTWSLAVEEQFYLAFILLVWLWRFSHRTRMLVLIAAAAGSVLAGLLLLPLSPKTAFFLAPPRAWELLLGVIAFQLVSRAREPLNPALASGLYYLALGGLIYACFRFSEGAAFPGPHAFIACISTAILILLFETAPGPQYRLLTTPPALYLGKISYSLYLWHWPIIALATMALGSTLDTAQATAAVAVSLLCAAASYHLLEQPVRQSRLLYSNRALLGVFITCCVAIAATGIALSRSDGALFRFDEPMRSLYAAAQERTANRCPKSFRVLNPRRETCPLNSISGKGGILVLGDSHADAIDQMLAGLGEDYKIPVFLTVRSCDFQRWGTGGHCGEGQWRRLLKEAHTLGIQTIIATSQWQPTGYTFDEFRKPLLQAVQADFEVIFSEVVPHDALFDPSLRARAIAAGQSDFPPGLPLAAHEQKTALQRTIFSRLQQEFAQQVSVLRPADYLCNESYCDFATGTAPNYSDDSHLSAAGIRRIQPVYEAIFLERSQSGRSEP